MNLFSDQLLYIPVGVQRKLDRDTSVAFFEGNAATASPGTVTVAIQSNVRDFFFSPMSRWFKSNGVQSDRDPTKKMQRNDPHRERDRRTPTGMYSTHCATTSLPPQSSV
jgi:hypothetical protein